MLLITTICLQILSNLANDLGDAVKGVDGEHRSGPARSVQLGLISKGQMQVAIIVFVAFSLLFGSLLLFQANVFADTSKIYFYYSLGVLSILGALFYTLGKKPYGYAGLGDISVFIFFGLVGVLGSYSLYLFELNYWHIVPACTVGFLSVGVLNVNNIRDIESDTISGKKSIPVRIGLEAGKTYHSLLIVVAIVLILVSPFIFNRVLLLGTYVIIIPLVKHLHSIVRWYKGYPLDPELKRLSLTTFFYSIIFITAFLF